MDKLPLPGLNTDEGLLFLWNYLCAHSPDGTGRAAIDGDAIAVLAHCVERLRYSKAGYLQDLYVSHKLRGAKDGFFVEFGAADGILLSNTYYLEKHLGWDGILAEPLPDWNHKLLTTRAASVDNRCVWSESGKTLEFRLSMHPELSSIKGFGETDSNAEARLANSRIFEVETISLNDLLAAYDAPRTIDFLSIDTEGSELEILRAFDFARYQVRVLIVEHNYTETREPLRELIEAQGFVREFTSFSKNDDWYYHPGRLT